MTNTESQKLTAAELDLVTGGVAPLQNGSVRMMGTGYLATDPSSEVDNTLYYHKGFDLI